jgi:hypothetical protein
MTWFHRSIKAWTGRLDAGFSVISGSADFAEEDVREVRIADALGCD